MRYVQINTVPDGSTGKIMMKKHQELLKEGHDSFVVWGRGRPAADRRELRIGSRPAVYADAALSRMDGRAGFHSWAATRELIRKLDELRPDIVHLHNIHGYYLNVEMLFEWLEKSGVQVIWTLHDCWAFTGHCAYFSCAGCEQWKTGCGAAPCPQIEAYPRTYSQGSVAWNYERKERVFTCLPADRMRIIVPSDWLKGLVEQSFLSKYEVEVRPNTIDFDTFRPTPSDFRARNHLEKKFVILGVASPWSERKGLSDFLRLRRELPDNASIVLVGLDKATIQRLPEGVVGLQRTASATELAEVYTAADVFFNPTREDNYPTVNLEAEACGTPVVTYDVGGCRETIKDARSSAVPGYDEAVLAITGLMERGQTKEE